MCARAHTHTHSGIFSTMSHCQHVCLCVQDVCVGLRACLCELVLLNMGAGVSGTLR